MRCLIIDDELHAIKLLKTLLKEYCPEVKVLASYTNIQSALSGIELLEPDFVFLDIRIGSKTAFDLLNQYSALPFKIIFTTAYSEYSLTAFDYGGLHYLTKPIGIDKLEEAVDRVKMWQSLQEKTTFSQLEMLLAQKKVKRIALPNRYGNEYVFMNQILYCEASGSYTTIHLDNGEEKVVSKHLGYFEQLLDDQCFVRVHKKYLVNSDAIVSYRKGRTGTCMLSNRDSVEVSEKYKNRLVSLLRQKIAH